MDKRICLDCEETFYLDLERSQEMTDVSYICMSCSFGRQEEVPPTEEEIAEYFEEQWRERSGYYNHDCEPECPYHTKG